MTALYIIAGTLLFVLLILLLRITIAVSYSKARGSAGSGAVYAIIGPVRIKLYPKRQKKLKLSDFSAKNYRKLLKEDARKAAEPDKSESKSDKQDTTLPGGIGETFELISELLEKFTGHLRCEVVKIRISVGTRDAASTAFAYAGISSAAGFLLEAIDTRTVMRLRSPKDIWIKADFDSDDIFGDIGFRFSIRIINILRAGSGFIMNYVRTMMRLDRQNSKSPNNRRKTAERS